MGRPAWLCIPIAPAGDQADLYRCRHYQRTWFITLLLRRGHLGPNDRRPAADRIDPGWRSGPVAGHFDRSARVSARDGHPSQSACPHAADRGRRRIDRRHRHPPLLEGGQGLDDGPRAQGRRSLEDGRRHGRRSNRSSLTRLNRFTTSTSPRTATFSSGPRACWSTTSASCSRSSSRLINSRSWAHGALRRSKNTS